MTPNLTNAVLDERRAEAEACIGVLNAHPPLTWYFDLDDAYSDALATLREIVRMVDEDGWPEARLTRLAEIARAARLEEP